MKHFHILTDKTLLSPPTPPLNPQSGESYNKGEYYMYETGELSPWQPRTQTLVASGIGRANSFHTCLQHRAKHEVSD